MGTKQLKQISQFILNKRRGYSNELPKSHIDWITHPASRFFKIEAAAGLLLLFFTILALILANSSYSDYYHNIWHTYIGISIGQLEFGRSLHHWINDAMMTLFFFLVSLELKREFVLGELRDIKIASLSVSGAIGGMLVPAWIYQYLQTDLETQHGWGVVMATDTAFLIGCLALLGTRIPKGLRTFMLSLVIFDDIGAIIVVAIGYSDQINLLAAAITFFGFFIVKLMAKLGVRSITLFFIVGSLIWLAMDATGIHATITGVILGLMTPTKKWVSDDRLHAIMNCVVAYPPGDHWSGDTNDRRALKTAEAAAREALSPLERLEIKLHPWVGFFIVPLFAFANAGISLENININNQLTLTVFLSLIIGKPIGIFLFSCASVKLGISTLPADLNWRLIFSGGILAGIGFTMAMFIANLAYDNEQLNAAKLGIMIASIYSSAAGLTLLIWFTKKEKTKN